MHGPAEKDPVGEQSAGIKRGRKNGVCVGETGEVDGCDCPCRVSVGLEAVPFRKGRRIHLA